MFWMLKRTVSMKVSRVFSSPEPLAHGERAIVIVGCPSSVVPRRASSTIASNDISS